jgi:hypothetical protein
MLILVIAISKFKPWGKRKIIISDRNGIETKRKQKERPPVYLLKNETKRTSPCLTLVSLLK